jgi:hypothetical protein
MLTRREAAFGGAVSKVTAIERNPAGNARSYDTSAILAVISLGETVQDAS